MTMCCTACRALLLHDGIKYGVSISSCFLISIPLKRAYMLAAQHLLYLIGRGWWNDIPRKTNDALDGCIHNICSLQLSIQKKKKKDLLLCDLFGNEEDYSSKHLQFVEDEISCGQSLPTISIEQMQGIKA
ncbi:hypothetical protein OPV22_017470 [Ensete ventricosum]|uniref:Uncharacterized protein n=1 Tax=Ensete ventricosum TaxID=4639 RepID=A0AAV8QTU1_ENSVE|nr:hypothetical protein OPV22_017470 [Ensete ventricosum]